jgi:uncharacterized membrane protein
MNEPSSIERTVSARYTLLLTLWGAQMMALVTFFMLALFVFERKENSNDTMLWIMSAVGLMLVAASFLIKQKLLALAVEKQSPAHVQQGQIVATALCEAAALLGLVARAVTGTPYFYLPFAVAALGLLLHFPKREALLAASFRNRI